MDLYFYNFGHTGDLHYTREYIKDIINKTNYDNYYYLKDNSPINKIFKDIPKLQYGKLNEYCLGKVGLLDNHFFLRVNDDAQYLKIPLCWNQDTCYFIFEKIYDKLQIKLESMNYYEPSINYNSYDLINIKEYLKSNINRFKILISNSDIQSFQSSEIDFYSLIDLLSNEYPNVDFILTKKIELKKDNVYYTSDIININENDLNEISYLSTHCNIIIGRASGPFIYSLVKENLRDINKTLIPICNHIDVSIHFYDNSIDKIFINNYNFDTIHNILKNTIEEKTYIDNIISITKNINDERIYISSIIKTNEEIKIDFYKNELFEITGVHNVIKPILHTLFVI